MYRFFTASLVLIILLVFLQGAFPALAEGAPHASAAAQASAIAQAQSACGATYTVVSGDTMYRIAARCGVTYAALIAVNTQIVNPNLIFPGQVINIPTGSIPPTGSYRIVAGDTLYSIARRFNTTVDAIVAANTFITNPNLIYPGQIITIPAGPGVPPTGPRTYVIQPGDTLVAIAARFNTSVDAILYANTWIVDPDRIWPGQVLTLP